jgi:hypothetical protein
MQIKTIKKVLYFAATAIAILIILSIFNVRRPMSLSHLQTAILQIGEFDKALRSQSIDWPAMKKLYHGPLETLVKETKRFVQKADLHGKIEDSISEGKKGYVDDVQSIILRRTLLRVCLYHLEALLTPKDPQEVSLTVPERIEHIEALLGPVYAFARELGQETGVAYQTALEAKWVAWKANPTAVATQDLIDAVDGMSADVVLYRLSQWRTLQTSDKEQRRKAVVLQAEMRQLFHIFYTRLYDRIHQQAWEALTEFTNEPNKMNADQIEKVIRENLVNQLKTARGDK